MSKTDRKEQGSVLHELQLARITVDKALDPVLWIAPDACILYGNEAACRGLGYTREALLTLRITDLDQGFPEEDIQRRWQELVASGSVTFETSVRTAGGRLIPVEVTSHHVAHAEGELGVSTVRDLSEKRGVEAALKRSEATYLELFDAVEDAIFIHDPATGQILDINASMTRLFGYSPEESRTLTVGEMSAGYPPFDQETAAERLRKAAAGETQVFEWHCRHKDGHLFWADVSLKRGVLAGQDRVLALVHDVTDRKQALEALQESQARFRTVVEESNDAIYILYEDRFDLVNRRFCEMHGVSPEEVRDPSFSFWTLLDPESVPLIRERLERRARGEQVPGVYNFTIRRKDGTRVQVEASTTGIDYKGGQAVLGILRDNSEQNRLEEQLRQSQKLESIGRLSGGVAHDLNNLLSPILVYGELLLEDLGVEDQRRELAEEIVSAAARAKDLIRQLLAFSRKQTLEFQPLDLNALIQDFQKLLRRTIREDIELVLSLAPDLPRIQADLRQVEQVILNLAVNAQEAMPAGGVLTIETGLAEMDHALAATRPGVKPGRYVLLAVSDNGVGMNEATIEMIFEPFFTTKKGGTGLGLATVYGIVKQHGGNIWAYSEPGQGTTFRSYFPVMEGEVAASPPELDGSQDALVEPGASETVLLVEDESMVRAMAQKVLTRVGYTVLPAANADECMELLDNYEGPLDLILTDVVLPGMNGRALVEEVNRRFPSARALFMSGYTNEVITKHGVLEEGIAFIQKPFTVLQLTARVREVLKGG